MTSFLTEKQINEAKSHVKRGDLDKASALFLKILTKFPKNIKAKNGLIFIHENLIKNYKQELLFYYNQKKYLEITKIGTKLVEKFSHSYFVWDILGASFLNQGNYLKAIWAYEKLISLNENYSEAYTNLGQAFYSIKRYEDAVSNYKKALILKTKDNRVYYYLGISFEKLNKTKEALTSFKKTIMYDPKNAKAYFKIAELNNKNKDFGEAIRNYKNAIIHNPKYYDALNNLGNALISKGLINDAIMNYKKANMIKVSSNTFNNLGIAFKMLGNYEEAIRNYDNAISLEPKSAVAYYNKAIVLQKNNKYQDALNCYVEAILINPNYENAYYNLAIILKKVVFNRPFTQLNNIVVSILERKTFLNPNEISKALLSLLKHEEQIKNIINVSYNELDKSFLEITSKLSKLPLLVKLLSIWTFTDIEFENLFKNIRSVFLSKLNNIKFSKESLCFLSSLSKQCFLNEFIYYDEDHKKILEIEKFVEKKLIKGKQPRPEFIICLASYKPLNNYKWFNLLEINEIISDLYKMQVTEPLEEKKLKKFIPSFGKINDKVSANVKNQYESNPYPRWVNTGLLISSISIGEVVDQLELDLFDNKIKEIKNPSILVAGCGTGEHAIKVANRFKNSSVLAIDLSIKSLSYAKRKTKELNLKNIEYIQGDILNIKNLKKQFDIIECVGTLHHMDDPFKGWKNLVNSLSPEGIMKIGLYSHSARVNVIKIRDQIKRLNINTSDNEIKLFRKKLIESNTFNDKNIIFSNDFYSLSSVRDLLFHVQEHTFTISQIKNYLDKLGLRFCGFELVDILEDFKKIHFADKEYFDLNKWDVLEKNNPSFFGNMYQFWCQKISN